jgi:2-haloacid dehalogenase
LKPAAVVFDLFGTLLEIASLETAAARYTADASAFVATWREKQLAYAFASTIMGRYEDFDALTLRALRYAVDRYGAAAGWETLADEWRCVQPYADALPALAGLRATGIPAAVLTNGTPATSRAALQSAAMSDAVAVTLSVDAVRVYKPDARVYALATAHFGVRPSELIFVTSNGWDATGATAFGLNVVWCNRLAAPAETLGEPPATTIATLAELAPVVTRFRDSSTPAPEH